jgi:hypothetical protein
MSTEGDELGRFKPVPDALVLAAVHRAERHNRKHVLHRQVAEHLGFAHGSGTTRRLRPQLESLRAAGSLERTRKHGQERWTLTPAGSRRLGAARRARKVGELPESPQHRGWRRTREEAEARYDDFRTVAYEALEAAEDALELAEDPGAKELFELSERLRAAFRLLGSATYCRSEWPEPDDARADRAAGDVDQQGRGGTANWKHDERRAKGGSHG